ncbi:MAG: hypothetical protein ACOY4R_12475 [Pseudomonadota bacterium]
MNALGGSIRSRLASATHIASLASSSLFSILTTVLALLIIGSVFLGGLQRGMDQALSYGPQSEENALAIAISEMVYGLDSYVAHFSVLEALEKSIHRGADSANDPKILQNLYNGDLINEGIASAASLGPRTKGFIADGGLKTMVYDDVGIVDFIKIAFAAFGFKVQSLYYLFFATLLLSTTAFILQYWKNALAQILALCNLFAFYMELQSPIFTRDMPTFWGMRHGSTLAILPMWHLALLLMYRTRLSLAAVVLAAIQVAILVLAIKVRGSALWTVIFMGGLTALLLYQDWAQLKISERSAAKLTRLAARWPMALVLAGLFLNGLYTNSKLHPAYFTDDILPHHGAWHSAVLGLNTSPAFWPVTGLKAEPGTNRVSPYRDRVGYDAALAYLRDRGFIKSEAEYLSPWTGTYKMGLHDKIMRRLFFSAVERHPMATVALYLYWKPRQILVAFGRLLAGVKVQAWLLALLGASIMAVAFATSQFRALAELRTILLLAMAAILFSALPNLWAYAAYHAVADSLLSIFILGVFGIWAAEVVLIERWRSPTVDEAQSDSNGRSNRVTRRGS